MLEPFALEQGTPRFPDRTFTGRRTEVLGGREIEPIEYGAAHTASDSVVFVPDARVVYTGDLLFAGVTPVMWHGPVSGWLAALRAAGPHAAVCSGPCGLTGPWAQGELSG
jgi:cyclase